MKKKIAFIVPRLTDGGAEKVVSILSRHLQQSCDVHIFIFDGTSIDYSYGGKLININVPAKGNILCKIKNVFTRIIKIRKLKRELDIDVSISLLEAANLVNILSKRRDKIIISHRSYPSENIKGLYGKVFKLLVRTLYNIADNIVTVSREARHDLINNFGASSLKTIYIYNPVDTVMIDGLKNSRLDSCEEHFFSSDTIINVGRLKQVKGQYHLIKSFNYVRQKYKNVKLLILGEGNSREELLNLIRVLDIGDSVHLLGFKNNPYKYISRSDIFVLSSLYEGFPNVILEAMACGLPIISTNCKSGPKEILWPQSDISDEESARSEKYGILTAPFRESEEAISELTTEEKELADNMLLLLKNKELREQFSKKSLLRINAFLVEDIVKEWEKIIFEE